MQADKLSVKLRQLVGYLMTHIVHFQPTHVLFSDPISLKATSTRQSLDGVKLVYMIHCAAQLPFGPYAGKLPGSSSTDMELDLLRKVDGIWSVSKAISEYSRQNGQLDTTPLAHHI